MRNTIRCKKCGDVIESKTILWDITLLFSNSIMNARLYWFRLYPPLYLRRVIRGAGTRRAVEKYPLCYHGKGSILERVWSSVLREGGLSSKAPYNQVPYFLGWCSPWLTLRVLLGSSLMSTWQLGSELMKWGGCIAQAPRFGQVPKSLVWGIYVGFVEIVWRLCGGSRQTHDVFVVL